MLGTKETHVKFMDEVEKATASVIEKYMREHNLTLAEIAYYGGQAIGVSALKEVRLGRRKEDREV